MPELGRILVAIGVVTTIVGALLWAGFGKGWLGRLPGDIHITGEKFSFHFPLVTCLLASALVCFVVWLLRR